MTIDQPWMRTPQIHSIFEALENRARLVGGCVRNALLEQKITDIDIATPWHPDDVITRLTAHQIAVFPTGIKHGTVTAVIDHTPFEITTLRNDAACDGRHAEVTFTDSWEEDASRRDFTINAMSCTLEGKIYDYFGGQSDLKKRRLRFVGNAQQRCQEDYLRILRYFRFFAYYGQTPWDEEALAACTTLASHIPNLSGERIQTEMLKLLAAPKPSDVLSCMHDAGILPYVHLPHANLATLLQLQALEEQHQVTPNALLRLAQLLRTPTTTADQINTLCTAWRLSNKDREALTLLCFPPLDLAAGNAESTGKACLYRLGKDTTQHLVFLRWAEVLINKDTAQTGRQEKAFQKILTLTHTWKIPVFPVNGQDIMALGIREGKLVGELLKLADAWWAAHDYGPTKPDILNFIKTLKRP